MTLEDPAPEGYGVAAPAPPVPRGTLWKRMFASPVAAVVTIAMATLLAWLAWHVAGWAVARAVARPDLEACKAVHGLGACWGFVAEKWRLIVFGRFPYDAQWRPAVATLAVAAMLVISAWPALWTRRGTRALAAGWILALAVFFLLMSGGVLGLEKVGTDLWGGLPLTVILTLVGIVASAPIGVALALARRSSLALLRTLAIGYIELVRGLPLITVLFVAAFIFPLLLPAGVRLDPFWRVAAGLVIFQAAYMAETVRGGLQTLPRGQIDAGLSLGMGWWQLQRNVVLPQALAAVIPAFVNNVLSTFIDTSLVTVVSMYDLTGSLRLALGDPRWRDFFIEGYLFIAAIYFGGSFAMSRYSLWLERRLRGAPSP